MEQCEICSATVRELRRGRCWGCYNRWVETRPVGLGAFCRMCGERRRAHLKSVELLGSWVPCCHNCSARIDALTEVPASLTAIRQRLDRERRQRPRRLGRSDTRVFPYERRDDDRRRSRLGRGTEAPPSLSREAEGMHPVDDAMIVEIEELASELEALAASIPANREETGELTRIRAVPPPIPR